MQYSQSCPLCERQIYREYQNASFECKFCELYYYPESTIVIYNKLDDMYSKYRYYFDLINKESYFEQYINQSWIKVIKIKPFDLSLGKQELFSKLKKYKSFV